MESPTEAEAQPTAGALRWVKLLAVGLALCAVVWMAATVRARHRAALAAETHVWRLDYDVHFHPLAKGARLRAFIPQDTPHARVFRETFAQPGSVLHVRTRPTADGREAWVVGANPVHSVRMIAQFDIRLDPEPRARRPSELGPASQERYLRATTAVQHDTPQVAQVLRSLRSKRLSVPEQVDSIFRYCARRLAQGQDDDPSDALSTLQQKRGSPAGRARAMVALCRASKIPARVVAGFVLENTSNAQLQYWVEAYVDGVWTPYDLENTYAGVLPPNYMPVRFNGVQVLRGYEAELEPRFTIRPLPAEGQWFSILDLTRMSPDLQQSVAYVLMLPLAVLITVFFRNLVGIETFTAFGPGLLALSFMFADWRTAIVVFGSVMTMGLAGRALLARLEVAKGPRLGVILVLAIFGLTTAVSTLDYFGLTPSGRGVVMPMVVLTMMVERFYVRAEVDGQWKALKRLIGSVGVGIACVPILRIDGLRRLVLSFPEILLLVGGVLVLVGRYKGPRLFPAAPSVEQTAEQLETQEGPEPLGQDVPQEVRK